MGEDIVTQCIFNVELVTDDIERAMAKAHLDQSGFDAFRDELGPSRDATFIRDVSMDVSYDEQDLMKRLKELKEAESAEEDDENQKSYPDKSSRGHHHVADLSPTYETEEKKYAGEEKIVKENLIMEEKISEEETKKREEADRLDEFAMMEEFTYKSESVGTTKESELDNVIDHKHAVKDDKKSQEEYIGEIKIEESKVEKVENVQEDKSVENKIEEIKVKKIEEDELFENKIKSIHEDKHDFEEHVLPVKEVQQENKIESLHEDKYDFEEQAQPVKEVQKEEPFNLSTIENEPSIDSK